ncbi:MAG: UDP-N-acetylglucosamine 2-epimerase (non-hydrolyzing) [Actinomycetes bacterium]|jgi:UDP-N-acetylglucosamine 2-epimerase (non-hydrolysing)|nr:UDP-N-acetylglucosamine 2-epimerase (non-hydrolyzing) [Actinomycetes bacterium]
MLGTRPEAIKLAPVIRCLEDQLTENGERCTVINTGQHPGLAEDMLQVFDLTSDIILDVFTHGQGLSALSSRLIEQIATVFEASGCYDLVIVQGDTTSALMGAIGAFYAMIPVAHVEAGLRTSTLDTPFPEEMNRRLISRIARWHFAPTTGAVKALRSEGILHGVYATGNTVVDAQRWVDHKYLSNVTQKENSILCTMHRRENWGAGIESVCCALVELLKIKPAVEIRFILHPNPAVANHIRERLNGYKQIELIPPLGYVEFQRALKECAFVISDSGGVVEEAPTFGKQVLITRDETERTEAVECGCAYLVGTDSQKILEKVLDLLASRNRQVLYSQNPFGDGKAAERICRVLLGTEECEIA